MHEDHGLAPAVPGPELDLCRRRRRWPAAHPPAPPETRPGCRAGGPRARLAVLGPELDLPSSPPLASRPSGSTARDWTGLPCCEDHGLALPSLGQSLICAVVAAAGQPAVRQHRQGPNRAAVPRTTGSPMPSLGQSLILPSSPPLASRPSASTARDRTQLPCGRTRSGSRIKALLAASMASASAGRLPLRAISMLSRAKAPARSISSGCLPLQPSGAPAWLGAVCALCRARLLLHAEQFAPLCVCDRLALSILRPVGLLSSIPPEPSG